MCRESQLQYNGRRNIFPMPNLLPSEMVIANMKRELQLSIFACKYIHFLIIHVFLHERISENVLYIY